MSISQWTIAGSNSSHSLDISTVIVGASSLRFQSTGSGTRIAGLTTGANITTGKVRTILQWDGTGERLQGVFCMMQSTINHSNSAYLAILKHGLSTVYLNQGDPQTRFTQTNNVGGAGILSSAGLEFTTTTNTNYVLEMKWQRDQDSGFIFITISAGTGTNFANLSPKLVFTHTSGQFSTGVSAGVVAGQQDGGTKNTFFDSTRVFGV